MTKNLSLGNKAGRSIPCIDHYIGICPAPCLLREENLAEYRENIDRLRLFLSGKNESVLEELRNAMVEKAKKLEFEEAGRIKLQIEQIEKLGTKQIARDAIPGDHDIIVILQKYERIFISIVQIRNGDIVGMTQSEVENRLADTKEEVFAEFLAQRYFDTDSDFPPHLNILLKESITDPMLVDALATKKIRVEYPTIGPKAEMLRFAEYNLLGFAHREAMKSLSVKTFTKATQVAILEQLGYAANNLQPPEK